MLASVRISHKKVKLLHQKSDILILIITATPNSGFWFYNTCASTFTCWSASVVSGSTVPAQCRLLCSGPVICISGFWFYSTCASTSACRYASVVSGSTVLVQTLSLADQHQWFLLLQYLCRHLYLLICISGFWLYSTCASASASVLVQTLLHVCWWASVVSGSAVPVQAPLFADLHQWFLVLQYLCKRLCLLISINGFWFYSAHASASACWYSDKLQWFLVLQYLCWHFCLLMSISGFWFCGTCTSTSASWVADIKW